MYATGPKKRNSCVMKNTRNSRSLPSNPNSECRAGYYFTTVQKPYWCTAVLTWKSLLKPATIQKQGKQTNKQRKRTTKQKKNTHEHPTRQMTARAINMSYTNLLSAGTKWNLKHLLLLWFYFILSDKMCLKILTLYMLCTLNTSAISTTLVTAFFSSFSSVTHINTDSEVGIWINAN